jgi:hypothetical protein
MPQYTNGIIAFRPRGNAAPNSRRYAACFLRAQINICPVDTAANTHAASTSAARTGVKGEGKEGAPDQLPESAAIVPHASISKK